jgi:hypothetical protein
MEFVKQLIDDLENASARLAALETFFLKMNQLSPKEYRNEVDYQRNKMSQHFDGLRSQLSSLSR